MAKIVIALAMSFAVSSALMMHGGTVHDVYFATCTGNANSEGIYHSTLDLGAGSLSEPELVAKTPAPSFLAMHPNGKSLYAVSEAADGTVRAFAIDTTTKKLTLLNERPSGGSGPCHVGVDGEGQCLAVANYGGGSMEVLPINNDGSLGVVSAVVRHKGSSVNPQRQGEPHAHGVNFSPDGRFVFVTDLGLDKIMIYQLVRKDGAFLPMAYGYVKLKPGSGPRHFVFHPSGEFAYVINELDGTVAAYVYDALTGAMTSIQRISTLPGDFKGTSWGAEVRTHPNGKFLYASNRGHDSIAIYRIAAGTGVLALAGFQNSGGACPRDFDLDPSGRFCVVANQNSDNVCVFRVDANSGALELVGKPITLGRPVCVCFPRGHQGHLRLEARRVVPSLYNHTHSSFLRQYTP